MRLYALSVVMAACLPLQAVAQTPPQDCTVGPIVKTYGGTKWVMNSCADERTLTLMAATDSPAHPCFIVIAPSSDGYTLDGRGRGDKQRTQAAIDELGALSPDEIRALIAETRRQQKPK